MLRSLAIPIALLLISGCIEIKIEKVVDLGEDQICPAAISAEAEGQGRAIEAKHKDQTEFWDWVASMVQFGKRAECDN